MATKFQRPVESQSLVVYPGDRYWGQHVYIFINDLDDGTKCTCSKFTGDTKLRGVADAPPGCAAIQGDLDGLQN